MNIIKINKPIASTNEAAKEMARNNAPNGTVIIADAQTNGRGRFDRHFFSPPGTGLYLSIILRDTAYPHITTILTAVAVCRAIEVLCGFTPRIKWINDIYLNKKKVCGILAEDIGGGCIITGIGINVFAPAGGFPTDIKDKAAALYEEKSAAPFDIKDKLALEIIEHILIPADCRLLIAEYEKRLFVIGKRIIVNNDYTAVATGINEEGHLYIIRDNGDKEILSSGEISF